MVAIEIVKGALKLVTLPVRFLGWFGADTDAMVVCDGRVSGKLSHEADMVFVGDTPKRKGEGREGLVFTADPDTRRIGNGGQVVVRG